MNTNIENELKTLKGQFCSVQWERPAKTRKGTEGIITKRCRALNVRAGVTYDNAQAVQTKRENGELPKENAGLPWGEWIEFPYIIEHKGKRYYRFQMAANSRFETEWRWNGQPVSLESVQHYLLASETKKDSRPECFTISGENVITINRVS